MPLTLTDIGSVRVQVILSSLGFEGCGCLTMCHLLAACSLGGNGECSVQVQLWQTNVLNGFTLKNSTHYQENPTGTGSSNKLYTLSIPLDMEFTTGDALGLGFFHDPQIDAFDVHIKSAPNHTYLQWMTSGTTLSVQNATTVEGTLPILSVEGKCVVTNVYMSHKSHFPA